MSPKLPHAAFQSAFTAVSAPSLSHADISVLKPIRRRLRIIGPKFNGTPSKEPTATIEYVFDGWEPELKKVDGDATYTAKFKEQERLYCVNVSSNYAGGGNYSGDGKIYPYLSDGSISVSVNNGFVFEGWFVNNELKSTEETYSFEDIDADFELEARYSTIKKSITFILS